MLHREHHRGGTILQICPLQHPQDPALPHEGSSSAPGPSACHIPPPLLQLNPGWRESRSPASGKTKDLLATPSLLRVVCHLMYALIACSTSWNLMYPLIFSYTSLHLMYTLIVCCMPWHLMYTLIVYRKSWHSTLLCSILSYLALSFILFHDLQTNPLVNLC